MRPLLRVFAARSAGRSTAMEAYTLAFAARWLTIVTRCSAASLERLRCTRDDAR